MQEKRKSPRYPIRLSVFFPELAIWGTTENISLDGCFIGTNSDLPVGMILDFLLDIPIVGALALKGYIQHTQRTAGIGVQLVQVRFAVDQSEYYELFSRFVKLLPQMEAIRSEYLDMVQKGAIRLHSFPLEKTEQTGN